MPNMVSFVSGQMQDFISNIEFSLNFDTKTSVKVKKGDLVRYDGYVAEHHNRKEGKVTNGSTTSLRTAIGSGWLSLSGQETTQTQKTKKEIRDGDGILYKPEDYDDLKGGSFDSFLRQKSSGIYSSDDARTVKETTFADKNATSAPVKKIAERRGPQPALNAGVVNKMEVARDQAFVQAIPEINAKTTTRVSSSTVKPQNTFKVTEKYTVLEDNQGGIASAFPRTSGAHFTVDDASVPVGDGVDAPTLEELTGVVIADDIGGSVVSTVRNGDEAQEIEGVIMRKIPSIGNDGRVKVSSGSTPLMDLSGVRTQQEVDEMEKAMDPKPNRLTAIKEAATKKLSTNYVDMLPEDWSDMSWQKKVKFIKVITDINFIKFILRVESITAVKDACKTRLIELENVSNNG